MDLYVGNGFLGIDFGGPESGFLYRNNGNSNRWLKFKLVGTVSNRSGIGAKVRVKATIGGKTIWQLRQVSAVSGFHCQDDLRPKFGLGDASVAETVRIEWPSGTVQEVENVAPNQILNVIEPPKLEGRVKLTGGSVELEAIMWKSLVVGCRCRIGPFWPRPLEGCRGRC